MRFGNYSVLIPEGLERDSGHVGMDHGRQYTIRIANHGYRQCDADVMVDDKIIGTFRLRPHGTTTLERSPDDNGRFTFYSAGTSDAAVAGEASIATENKGLIQVRFVPEKPRLRGAESVIRTASLRGPGGQSVSSDGMARSFNATAEMGEKTCGGITGLSGHSGQQFQSVGAIDRDESDAVTISLRLVTANHGPRPLKSAGVGNAIPRAV